MKDKIKKIASHYDFSNQIMQLSEECAELIQAVNKYRRFRGSKNTRDEIVSCVQDSNMLIQNIAEEIADCEIMLEQMKIFLNISNDAIEGIKEKKVNRQLARIEREGVK